MRPYRHRMTIQAEVSQSCALHIKDSHIDMYKVSVLNQISQDKIPVCIL